MMFHDEHFIFMYSEREKNNDAKMDFTVGEQAVFHFSVISILHLMDHEF